MTKLESFLIGIGLFLACAIDSFLTFIGVEKGVIKEINPVTLCLIKAGWHVFFFIKLLLPLVLFVFLILLGERLRWIGFWMLFMLVFYLAVSLWSTLLLVLVF